MMSNSITTRNKKPSARVSDDSKREVTNPINQQLEKELGDAFILINTRYSEYLNSQQNSKGMRSVIMGGLAIYAIILILRHLSEGAKKEIDGVISSGLVFAFFGLIPTIPFFISAAVIDIFNMPKLRDLFDESRCNNFIALAEKCGNKLSADSSYWRFRDLFYEKYEKIRSLSENQQQALENPAESKEVVSVARQGMYGNPAAAQRNDAPLSAARRRGYGTSG